MMSMFQIGRVTLQGHMFKSLKVVCHCVTLATERQQVILSTDMHSLEILESRLMKSYTKLACSGAIIIWPLKQKVGRTLNFSLCPGEANW